ncbi:molybdenum cofactor sulfurase [Limnohabitans sp. MORI2]|uniref:MOSC domain-containing protein n=1 Tax=Limnohabitans sp. MORI2 TaxID=1751150 RepID=UPI0023771724|nr:MOSC domain-containing protein [Limnohabitans sp. MORI2]BDU58281.1 molybdenum cofactor sulfurase [Limnohabitans sp. MORI2]
MTSPRSATVSIFIGQVRALPETGRPTGMYKTAVQSPIALGVNGFEGDQQADLRVHGGPDKAVHLYPTRHYAQLAAKFDEAAALMQPGSMGENIATPDLDEHDVRLGDVWQLGTALIQVCQPRNPCWKIDERFGADGMALFIDQHLLTGWYWRVLQTGVVNPTDTLVLHEAASHAPTLHQAMTLWREHRPDLAALSTLAETPGIAKVWQDKIKQRVIYLMKPT